VEFALELAEIAPELGLAAALAMARRAQSVQRAQFG
jgi:hypothetical protein